MSAFMVNYITNINHKERLLKWIEYTRLEVCLQGLVEYV